MEENIRQIKLGFVNVFLIRLKDGYILIDTGLNSSWNELENELLRLNVLPDYLKLVILTHADQDHYGNCKNLQDKYGIKIAMHKDDYPLVESGKIMKRTIKPILFRTLFRLMSIRNIFIKRSQEKIRFKPNYFLSDGASLVKFGLDAKVIHIPGHTKGSIAILTKDLDLFVGDTFTNRKRPMPAYIVENQMELDNSIERIKSLYPKKIYVGHGDPFLLRELM